MTVYRGYSTEADVWDGSVRDRTSFRIPTVAG